MRDLLAGQWRNHLLSVCPEIAGLRQRDRDMGQAPADTLCGLSSSLRRDAPGFARVSINPQRCRATNGIEERRKLKARREAESMIRTFFFARNYGCLVDVTASLTPIRVHRTDISGKERSVAQDAWCSTRVRRKLLLRHGELQYSGASCGRSIQFSLWLRPRMVSQIL
jgi:hypothetical protein